MEIFKIKPRPVILIDNKVYKFFNTKSECINEVNRINKSPFSHSYDQLSCYNMKFVKILETNDNFYTMEKVNGKCISIFNKINDFNLAGRWLRCFHDLTYDSKNKTSFLFGDFIPSHIFIDHNYKEISAIDPGTSFGNYGEIEIDISRFLVGLFQTKNFDVIKLNRVLVAFLSGYGKEKINFSNLNNLINLRIYKNYDKTIKLNTGLFYHF